jgi:hypothetical protein
MSTIKEQLIAGLNTDLANEYQAIITYITYGATVTGIYREEMKEFFMREVPDELRHAEYLANKIAALGGTPTTTPVAVTPASDLKQMLIECPPRRRGDHRPLHGATPPSRATRRLRAGERPRGNHLR